MDGIQTDLHEMLIRASDWVMEECFIWGVSSAGSLGVQHDGMAHCGETIKLISALFLFPLSHFLIPGSLFSLISLSLGLFHLSHISFLSLITISLGLSPLSYTYTLFVLYLCLWA